MKRFEIFVFLVLVFGCSDIEDENPIEKRKIIGQINDEIAYLGVEKISVDKFGFVFELQNPGDFKFLSVLDSDLICGASSKKDCLFSYQYHLNNYTNSKLWYRISGVVMEFNPKDGLSGNPFEITKAERILSCPVKYDLISEEVPLVNELWRFIGFIDESGKVYSHPYCENIDFIMFKTYETSNSRGYLQVPSHGENSFSFMRGFTILSESKKIAFILIPMTYAFPRTPDRKNPKMDSLATTIGYDTIDYVLENNILKLQNPKNKLNAMFVAN